MSDCGVACLPCACSGEMYCAVPTTMPSCVICSWFVEYETPKSVILTSPLSETMMFAGLTSRWITPCECATNRPRATCTRIGSSSVGSIGPLSSWNRSASDLLGTYSMMRNPMPSCS